MELVLEILNPDNAGAKQQLSRAFGLLGGCIGRDENVHWPLTDNGQQMSRDHARIHFRTGHFWLTDMSTNGTWLKATGERLEKHLSVRIDDGVVYQMGGFDIRARLEGAQPSPAVEAPAAPVSSLMIPEHIDFSQSPTSPLPDSPPVEPQQCGDYAPIEREHMIVPTLAPPTPEPEPIPEPLPPDQNELFWQHFAQALGVDLDGLDQTRREALALETARLFKLSVGHLQQSLRTRTELKNELRLALTTGQYVRQNTLKHAATTRDALKGLLLDSPSTAHAERSITRSFSDLQAHQVAMLSASRAALRSTLDHFAPQHLALRFEREGHKPFFATSGALWRQYGRYHQALAQDDDWSERLLARDFAQAYEEQVRLIDSLQTDPQG
ncbi:MAG: type secretion system domain protein [Pseudomonas sp.]|nr:type secretion system domain protein [Pseudomonas sp.]